MTGTSTYRGEHVDERHEEASTDDLFDLVAVASCDVGHRPRSLLDDVSSRVLQQVAQLVQSTTLYDQVSLEYNIAVVKNSNLLEIKHFDVFKELVKSVVKCKHGKLVKQLLLQNMWLFCGTRQDKTFLNPDCAIILWLSCIY